MPERIAAVYVRVSTDRQTVQNQLLDLLRLVVTRGYIPEIYEEVESAAKARPVLDRMLADARAGKVHAVAVWALDRLHRSMVGSIQTVLECDRIGVSVISLREPWLDTSGPVRPLLVAIFGWVAEQERARLIERTKAGLERARQQGVKLGRPRASAVALAAAAERVRAGTSYRLAAKEYGVGAETLRRYLREACPKDREARGPGIVRPSPRIRGARNGRDLGNTVSKKGTGKATRGRSDGIS